jgi:hypothetical protein
MFFRGGRGFVGCLIQRFADHLLLCRRRTNESLTSGEQDAVTDLVADDPARGDLIQGTGGLRKPRARQRQVGVVRVFTPAKSARLTAPAASSVPTPLGFRPTAR